LQPVLNVQSRECFVCERTNLAFYSARHLKPYVSIGHRSLSFDFLLLWWFYGSTLYHKWKSKSSEREREAESKMFRTIRRIRSPVNSAFSARVKRFESNTAESNNEWQETKNRQGRVYYVNTATGERIWDHPGPDSVVKRISKLVIPEYKNISDRVYNVLVNSTNAYYGVFLVACGFLGYRIMYPPTPEGPTIGPVKEN